MMRHLVLFVSVHLAIPAVNCNITCLPGFVKALDGQCYTLSNEVTLVSNMKYENSLTLICWLKHPLHCRKTEAVLFAQDLS